MRILLTNDDGIHAQGLAALRPVMEGGSVTFGTQTHPADANAGANSVARFFI